MTPEPKSDLLERLEAVRKDHLRLASWWRNRDKPARVAFHHDAAQAIASAKAALSLNKEGKS